MAGAPRQLAGLRVGIAPAPTRAGDSASRLEDVALGEDGLESLGLRQREVGLTKAELKLGPRFDDRHSAHVPTHRVHRLKAVPPSWWRDHGLRAAVEITG